MNKEYRKKNTSVFMINYHIIFCPKYRRKIFDIPGLEESFKELVTQVCHKYEIEIIAMECQHDHTHLFLSCPPTMAPYEVVKQLKGATGLTLRKEFSQLSKTQNLWTRSYFISTAGDVSSETIKKYVEAQKKNSLKQK